MNEMKAPAGSVFEMSGVPPDETGRPARPAACGRRDRRRHHPRDPRLQRRGAGGGGQDAAHPGVAAHYGHRDARAGVRAVARRREAAGRHGVSFAYVPTLLALANGYHDLGVILGAQIVGGCVAILFGIFVKQLRAFFPPMVTGTVIFTIGLSLYPTAVKYMAAARAPPTSVPGRTGWSPSSRWRSSSSATTSPRASPSWRPS